MFTARLRVKPSYSVSTNSGVFFGERSSGEHSPTRNNFPKVLSSTQLSAALAREVITISPVASLEPQIVKVESDSKEPTVPSGYGKQQPIIPPISMV